MSTKRRKLLLVPFGGLVGLVVVAATAYACTTFRGTMTVTGNAGGSVTVTGLRSGMLQKVSPGIAKATANNGSFTLATGIDGCCNRLPDKTASGGFKNYYVKFYNSQVGRPGYTNHTTWRSDCMAGQPGVKLGDVTIGANGQIATLNGAPVAQPVKFNLASGLRADTAPQESSVCLTDKEGTFGNEAPLTIV